MQYKYLLFAVNRILGTTIGVEIILIKTTYKFGCFKQIAYCFKLKFVWSKLNFWIKSTNILGCLMNCQNQTTNNILSSNKYWLNLPKVDEIVKLTF